MSCIRNSGSECKSHLHMSSQFVFQTEEYFVKNISYTNISESCCFTFSNYVKHTWFTPAFILFLQFFTFLSSEIQRYKFTLTWHELVNQRNRVCDLDSHLSGEIPEWKLCEWNTFSAKICTSLAAQKRHHIVSLADIYRYFTIIRCSEVLMTIAVPLSRVY